MLRFLLAIGLLATLVCACQPPESPDAVVTEGPAVGIARLAVEDPARTSWDRATARPVVTTVWYPAEDDAVMETIAFPADRPIFTAGQAARRFR